MSKVYVIMGVSGSGKTTIGEKLASVLKIPFYDADDFHPKSNIDKMAQGIPLEDSDRRPWLEMLRDAIASWKTSAVLACSALKESYRQILLDGNELYFIYLEGDYQTIYERMKVRSHFMKPELLKSQFDSLEPPGYGFTIGIDKEIDSIVNDIQKHLKFLRQSEIGIIGMGVMGKSLAKNFLSKEVKVSVYNRNSAGEEHIIPNLLTEINNPDFEGYTDIESFVHSLSLPRKVIMMIPAGKPIDEIIKELVPLLDKNDILIDGGNSHYKDTQIRTNYLGKSDIAYLGIGISGGEDGALKGPSMMVGGTENAFKEVEPLLKKIAAKGINDATCLGYFGLNGAGHFIKTIHNGIEYGEMQLLAEVYGLLRPYLSIDEIFQLLSDWNDGELSGFLLETTLSIFKTKDGPDHLLDKVLDVANSKGTGTWTSQMALQWGLSTPLLTEAVMARSISHLKKERSEIAKALSLDSYDVTINTERLKIAYSFARNINLLQGLHLIQKGNDEEQWNIELQEVVRVWTNGCILRSKLLEEWYERLEGNNSLWALIPLFKRLQNQENSVSEVLLEACQQRTSMPCFSSALHYWYGLSTAESSANLIQAQRDAFGAHTYKRIDRDSDDSFTSNWNGNG